MLRKPVRLIYRSILCLLMLGSAAHAYSQTSPQDLRRAAGVANNLLQNFPDYLSIRSEFLSQVVTAAPVNAFRFRSAVRSSPFGRIRVSLEREDASFFVLFQRERDGDFPYASRGNIIIKRATSTGYIQNIKWFLSDDGNSYLSMTANNERTQIDYVVAGIVVNRNVSVNTMIYYFLIQPFSFLHNTLRPLINWTLVFAANGPAESLELANRLRNTELYAPVAGSALAALLRGTVNLAELDTYLLYGGTQSSDFRELTGVGLGAYMQAGDERDRGRIAEIAAWKADSGYEAVALPYLIGLETGRLFLAVINCSNGLPNRNLLVIPYTEGDGSYSIFIWDPTARKEVSVSGYLESCTGAQLRLFSLPFPRL